MPTFLQTKLKILTVWINSTCKANETLMLKHPIHHYAIVSKIPSQQGESCEPFRITKSYIEEVSKTLAIIKLTGACLLILMYNQETKLVEYKNIKRK